MNNYQWQEGLQTTLLYLDDKHQIFECITEGADYGKLSFSSYTPLYIESRVLAYLTRHNYVAFTICTFNGTHFKHYVLTDEGYKAFHEGAKIWQS